LPSGVSFRSYIFLYMYQSRIIHVRINEDPILKEKWG
jgi:hypothetical protein